jgi:ABC-type transport system substrate-binding protein
MNLDQNQTLHLSRTLRSIALCLAALLLPTVAMAAADPNKVYRTYFPAAEDGFDPPEFASLYSSIVCEAIFERLLTYDYLARPAKVVPMVAEALPEVSGDGRTYTFKLKKGIHFTPDPAFKGKPRELVASDFVYSFKRFMDPQLRSPWQFLLEGKIVGLDELAAEAQKSGKYDYDKKIDGLTAVDDRTLRIRLKAPDYNFNYIMAHASFGAMAREVVEAYGKDIIAHPVGTGAYLLREWKRRNRIVLEANPDYRGFVWNFKSSGEKESDAELIRAMQGKTMPQIGRVEISIIEEPQSIWLAFKGKQLDAVNVPQQFIREVLDNGQLAEPFRREGIRLYRATDPEITYTFFNFKDPVTGGFTKEKIALRRAIAMAYNVGEEIRVIRQGQAIKAQSIIPPGVVGHNPKYRSSIQYDPDLANKLLDRFGYKKGADGYRTLPDGAPLLLHMQGDTSGAQRPLDELWKKSLDAIGIHMEFPKSNFADNIKAARACKIQMMGSAWGADYPDGDNFMQNLYGPNSGQSNNGCYVSPAFDRLYEQARKLPDSPERNRLYEQMNRQMEADTAWSLHITRLRTELIQPWVKGFKKHPILQAEWQYMDIDKH